MKDIHPKAKVKIKDRDFLEHHMKTKWMLHHPLVSEQLDFSSQVATIKESYEYHGGEGLYALNEVPGLWRWDCIEELKRLITCDSCGCEFRLPNLLIDVIATCPACKQKQRVDKE